MADCALMGAEAVGEGLKKAFEDGFRFVKEDAVGIDLEQSGWGFY